MLDRKMRLCCQRGALWTHIIDDQTGIKINLVGSVERNKPCAKLEIMAHPECDVISAKDHAFSEATAVLPFNHSSFSLEALLINLKPNQKPWVTFYELFVYTEGFPRYAENTVDSILEFHYGEKSMAKTGAVMDTASIKREMKRIINARSGNLLIRRATHVTKGEGNSTGGKRHLGWFLELPDELQELVTVFGASGEIIGLKGDDYYFPVENLGVAIHQDLDHVHLTQQQKYVTGKHSVPHNMGMIDGAVIWEILTEQLLANLLLRKSKVRTNDIPLSWEIYSAVVIGIQPQLINYGIFTWDDVAKAFLKMHANDQ